MLQQLALLTLLTIGAEAEPSDPIILEGRVLSPDGLPVEEAIVSLLFVCDVEWDGNRCYLGSTESDADGRFRLEANREAPPGSELELHVVRVNVGQKVLPFQDVDQLPAEVVMDPPAWLDVVLLLARTSERVDQDLWVQGRVDKQSHFAWTDHLLEFPKVELKPTEVGGHVRRARVPMLPRSCGFVLMDRQGTEFATRSGVELKAGREERRIVDLSGRIHFRLVDRDTGEPIPRASVSGIPQDPDDLQATHQAQVDENGWAEIEDISPFGGWTLRISKRRYCDRILTVEVPSPGEDIEEVTLERWAELVGSVRLPAGQAIRSTNAVVSIGDDQSQERRGRVNRRGEFYLSGLPPGVPLEVQIEKAGLPIGEPQRIVLEAGEERRITFEF